MEKTTTISLRINPVLKKQAEEILDRLGINLSVAVNMYLKQIVLHDGIPFDVRIPEAPARVDISRMSDEEIIARLNQRMKEVEEGKIRDAAEAFEEFRKSHGG